MFRRKLLPLTIACLAALNAPAADFARDVQPRLRQFCTDCHDAEAKKGGLDLARFTSDAAALADRATWKRVFDQLEAGQMPPPKRTSQPTPADRAALMAFATELLTRPDPALGARDPGQPVLRRLTRLEYNNSVRDLLALDTDVFMFAERLPLADKRYFQPATGALGDRVEVRLREYGGKYPVLLPQAGLPADSRAEHGFRNRGDGMNFSPLLLEQYVALARDIAQHPELPQRSRIFAELLGVPFNPRPTAAPVAAKGAKKAPATGDLVSPAVAEFAPNAQQLTAAPGSADTDLAAFRKDLATAFAEGRGGVLDLAANVANSTVSGKGAVLRAPFAGSSGKVLSINPDADLWLVSFSTATATSGNLLIANKAKGEKKFELSFKVERGERGEGLTRVGLCVLGRRGQSGAVALTARFSDDTTTTTTVELAEGPAGTRFVGFAAVPGEVVKSLAVDGTKFSGDYVLLDDLAFVTSGAPVPGTLLSPSPAVKGTLLSPVTPPAQTKAKALIGDRSVPATAPGPGDKSAPATLTGAPAERLAQFLERAFRRPPTSDERARFLSVFDRARQAGQSEPDALRASVQAILAAPGFLFLAEPLRPDAPKVRALDGFELSARLSYFLWASAPDAELLTHARSGALTQPATLAAQTRRLLRDPRARELSEGFAVQWLRLDQLYTAKPDRELFKAFYSGPLGKDTLHGAQLVEALLLFETVLVEDRSVLDFVGANYTWLNPRLAKFYGLALPGTELTASGELAVPGQPNRELQLGDKNPNNTWHRVPLSDATRGGFLTMGGPLTVTSLPFRTSPVKRGAWLLETIFNRPPVEPKVAFALKDDTKEASHATTVRARFEQHRNDPNCFSCHVRLDPPGFALEAFSPVGQLRTRDGEAVVDASGEWNGRRFNGPAEFKAAVLARPEEFTRGFIEHLLSYALGRKLEAFDMPAVAEIQHAAARDNHRLSALVTALVQSHPFRHTRNIAVVSSVK